MDTLYSRLPDPELQAEFYADVPLKRLLAWVVDSAIVLGIGVLLLPLTAFAAVLVLPVYFFVVSFLYRWRTLAGGSATWGMRLMAIQFRTREGELMDGRTALLHTLGYTISVMAFPLQIVSIVLMLTGPRGQGLTDHILGTVALNRPAAV